MSSQFQLRESSIENVKDEYALIMQIWGELERQANEFTQNCTDIQNKYKNDVESAGRNHNSALQRIENQYSTDSSSLEYERSSALEQWQKKHDAEENETKKKQNQAKKDNEKVQDDSSKFRQDVVRSINNRKQQMGAFLTRIDQAEVKIQAGRYQKIVKKGTELYPILETTFDSIMLRDPDQMVKNINYLNEQFLRKVIHYSKLRDSCVEFYSMKKKAKELYDEECARLDAGIPDADKKVQGMIDAAYQRLTQEMRNLNSTAEQQRAAYAKYRQELITDFAKKKEALDAKHRQQIQQENTRFQNEGQARDERRKRNLMDALKQYQDDMLRSFPPGILKSFIDEIQSRRIARAEDYVTADKEPLNVPVGYIYFQFKQFLENKIVAQFMNSQYSFILKNGAFVFPYTIGINENFAQYYEYKTDLSETAKTHMQTLCLNTFLSTPPNKMRFHFIDPLKSGQSFAQFKLFEEENSSSYSIIPNGIQTDSQSIQQDLKVVVDHIKSMQVNTFKGQYKNIREYNAANVLNPQPYNIIGIMDFPAGFTAQSIELLSQVVATGKECGVYVIIMANGDQLMSLEPKLKNAADSIAAMCNAYQLIKLGYVDMKSSKDNVIHRIDPPMSIDGVARLAPVMKKGIQKAGRIIVKYSDIGPKKSSFLKCSTAEGISIPIGLSGASETQKLNLGMPGSQSIHALICGQIGSGKSRLLHAIITGALLQYTKDELQIYLIDFKSGTEFKIYADYNLPNFKVIAIESEQEFGLSVLRDIKKESERRAQIFNTVTKSDITSYNNSSASQQYGKMARVLIVIDEFHMLFSNANQAVATEASQIMDGILRLDRSYGFHMVLCSQSIRGMNAINEAALAQIAVRIALKCPKEDADIVLGKGSDAIAQIEENDAGSAIYMPAISSPKTSNKFRVGYLTSDEHMKLLEELNDYYNSKNENSDARILVSDVSDSRNSVFQIYYSLSKITAEKNVLHFGEPLRVDAKLEAKFRNAAGNNLILFGSNAQKAQNMLTFALMDLMIQSIDDMRQGARHPYIFVLNYTDGTGNVMFDGVKQLSEVKLPSVAYLDSSQAVNAINQIYQYYKQKTPQDPEAWLIISNLMVATDLQSGSVYGSYSETANYFEEILREGPAKGIFTVAWCDDPTLFKAKFVNLIQLFGKRIVFNVSDEDALALADVVKDESINRNNAYFYENGRGKEKFRPYSTPMKDWLDGLCKKMRNEIR